MKHGSTQAPLWLEEPRILHLIQNRGISNNREALKEMFKVLSDQRIENQIDPEIPPYTNQNV